MRILVITAAYPLHSGDYTGQFLHVTFRALCRQGHQVQVFRCQCRWPAVVLPRDWWINKGRPRYPRSYELEGVPVACPRFWRPPGGAFWRPHEGRWRYKAIVRSAAVMHGRAPFDVIYGCELMPAGVAALLLGRALDVPVLVGSTGSDAHAVPFRTRAAMCRTQWVLRNGDLIVVEGPGAEEDVRKLVPEPLQVRVFLRGIDLSAFQHPPPREEVRTRFGLPPSGRLIAFAGRLVETKGVRVLANAFARLQARFPDVGLVMMGAGPERARLLRQAARQSWKHKLHLLGWQPFNEVPNVLAGCDLFCLPSFGEGLPKSVLEAMAAGLPVVATTVGALPEVLEAGACGILVPSRDQAALEAALARLLADPDEASRLGCAGRRLVYERYDGEKNAARLLDIAREAIARAKGTTCSTADS